MTAYDAPIMVQGYASVFNQTYKVGNFYERIELGAFEIKDVYVTYEHDTGRRFAATNDGSLRLFQDDYGLGFEFAIRANRHGLGLIAGVIKNVHRAASFAQKGKIFPTIVDENGKKVSVVKRITLEEISLCQSGANPHTSVWLDSEIEADLPAHILSKRSRWIAGYQRSKMPKKEILTNKVSKRSNQAMRYRSVQEIIAHGRDLGLAI